MFNMPLRRIPAMPVLLVMACCLAYANSLANGFMMDDGIVLFGQAGVENKAFLEVLTREHGGFYRPVGHVLLWAIFRLAGHHVMAYHVVNLVLFSGIVLLFFAIFVRLTRDRAVAFLAALLYAVHPINGMIVNYVTASALAAFVLCAQATLLGFMRFFDDGRRRWIVLSAAAFLLALLAHEMSLIIPAYLAAYLFFMAPEKGRRAFWSLLPFAGVAAVFMAVRLKASFFPFIVHGAGTAMGDAAGYFTTWIDLLGWYLSKLVMPREVLFLWSVKYGAGLSPVQWMAFLLVAASACWAFFRWRSGWRPFVMAVFVAGLIPSAFAAFSYHPQVWPLLEPHWFYFSQFGFFLLAAALLMWLIREQRGWGRVTCAVLVMTLLVLAWDHNARWKTQESYARYWISLNNGNLTPYYSLGRVLLERGDCRGAVQVFQEGIRQLNYNNVYLSADAGYCYDVLDEGESAKSFLGAALKLDPSYALTYHYIGLYHMKRGDRSNAAAAFRKAVELDPRFSPSIKYLEMSSGGAAGPFLSN